MKGIITNFKDIEKVTQYVPFSVKIDFDYVNYWNKTLGDITDASLIFRKIENNNYTDVLSKSYTDMNLTNISFEIPVTQTDFTTLTVGKYLIRLGIQFSGETYFRDCGELSKEGISVITSWFANIGLQ